jgi:hypothetical protein
MLSGLGSQRPTLLSEVLVHAGDILLDLGDHLCQLGNLLPEGLALRPQLLGSHEQLRPAGVRISHHWDRYTLQPAARHGATQMSATLPRPATRNDRPCRARPASPVLVARSAERIRDRDRNPLAGPH